MALVLLRLEDMLRSLLLSPSFSTAENYPPWTGGVSTPCLVLLLAVEAGMVNFVRSYAELRGLDPLSDSQSTPLLHHALCQPFLGPLDAFQFTPSLAMVEYVLSLQPRPNVGFHRPSDSLTTPSEMWIKQIMQTPQALKMADDPESALLVALITEAVVKYGPGWDRWCRFSGPAFCNWVERNLVDFAGGTTLPQPIVLQVREAGRRIYRSRRHDCARAPGRGFVCPIKGLVAPDHGLAPTRETRDTERTGAKRSRLIEDTGVGSSIKKARGTEIEREADGI